MNVDYGEILALTDSGLHLLTCKIKYFYGTKKLVE